MCPRKTRQFVQRFAAASMVQAQEVAMEAVLAAAAVRIAAEAVETGSVLGSRCTEVVVAEGLEMIAAVHSRESRSVVTARIAQESLLAEVA